MTRRLILGLALVLLLGSVTPAHAAYTFVASVAAGSAGGGNVTTADMNTTGADTIVCYLAEQDSTVDAAFSDSKSNTWQTDITERKDAATANLLGRMFYCKNCTVGSGHNFTATSSSGKPSIACAAFSGGHLTAPLDQQNGNVDIDAGLNNTTGSITPSENDTLVVTGLGFSGGASATITIDGSYTITNQVDVDGSFHRGTALAYEIQTTATATNRQWTYSANQYAVASIASFKASAGGGGGGGSSFNGLLLGVGP